MAFRRIFSLLACLLCASAAHAEQMRSGGQQRTWTAQVPAGAHALPLVLVLHGNTQQGRDLRERTSWAATAAAQGFVVLFPDGLDRAWADLRSAPERGGASPPAGTDDAAFLLALVDRYVAAGSADPRRIYVAGVSNGGAMALSLACRHPDRFAAVASVVMAFTPTFAASCHPAWPIPVLMMNGSADPLIPYGGGLFHGRRRGAEYLSTAQTLAFWRKANGCAADDAGATRLPDRDPGDASTVTRIDSRCPRGGQVLLYRVDGGGHRMPDAMADARHPRLVDALLGVQNRDIAAPELIWRFFASQPAR
jgi:polyhydroxybutyrate depolymerase